VLTVVSSVFFLVSLSSIVAKLSPSFQFFSRGFLFDHDSEEDGRRIEKACVIDNNCGCDGTGFHAFKVSVCQIPKGEIKLLCRSESKLA
jgi:hypothetical protein